MKKLITIALLAPLAAFGQTKHTSSWEVGLNAGISSNPAGEDNFTGSLGTSTRTNFASIISIAKDFNHFQIGLEVCPTNLSYNFKTYDYVNNNPVIGTHKAIISNPAIPVYVFGNYEISIGKSKIYAGAAVGYFISSTTYKDRETVYARPKNSFAGGVQAGYEYFITKRIAIDAEVDYRYVFQAGTFPTPKNLYYYPVTLGVHFIL